MADPSAPALTAFPFCFAAWFQTPPTTCFFFFNDTATTEIYTLSLHDALPICLCAWYYKDSANHVYPGGGCPFNVPGYNDGQWHQVTFVVHATEVKLHCNIQCKLLIAWTGTPGASTTTQPVDLARYPGAYGGPERPRPHRLPVLLRRLVPDPPHHLLFFF